MHMVAMMTKLAGMPAADSATTMTELTTATTIAAVSGRSVMSLPSVSMVRLAMVNAPTATASDPTRMPSFMPSSPLPTSGAMAFATLLVPELNAIRQPIATTTVVPTSSRRVVFGPRAGRGSTPDRSTVSSAPSVWSMANARSMRG